MGLLDPQLTFSEAESAAGVAQGYTPLRPDGAALTPYDMKRLQVRQQGILAGWLGCVELWSCLSPGGSCQRPTPECGCVHV